MTITHWLYSTLFLFQLSVLFSFFVPTGLGDRNEEVRGEMLKAALTAVNQLGKVSNV